MPTHIKQPDTESVDQHLHQHNHQSCCSHNYKQQHHYSHHSSTFSLPCTHAPTATHSKWYTLAASNLARRRSRTSASLSGKDVLFKTFPNFFFMVFLLILSCKYVRGLPSDNLEKSSQLPVSATQDPSVNTTSPPNVHSTQAASINSPISSPSSSSSSKSNIPADQQQTPYDVPKLTEQTNTQENPSRADLINLLITTLEKLKVLPVGDTSCFRLEKITRKNINDLSISSESVTPSPISSHSSMGIFLYFNEVHVTSLSNSVKDAANGTTFSNTANRECVYDPIVELEERQLIQPAVPFSDDIIGRHSENSTVVAVGTDDDTTEMGIGRTHIVVISTCSAIIGMFFLVAGFLRIRNYIKRYRLEQEMENRPKFRSCSVALRGAPQSMEQLRRDSLISKASHQHSDTTKGSNSSYVNNSSRENSSSNSPRHDPDTAPLLLLPRGAQIPTPSTEAEACLQYVDENGAASLSKKKMVSPGAIIIQDTNANVTEYRSQLSPERAIAVFSITAATPSPSCSRNSSVNEKETARIVRSNVDGRVNPSFSSGSIGCHAVSCPSYGTSMTEAVSLPGVNKLRLGNCVTKKGLQQSIDFDSGETIMTEEVDTENESFSDGPVIYVNGNSKLMPATNQRENKTNQVVQPSPIVTLTEENNSKTAYPKVKGKGSNSIRCTHNIENETRSSQSPCLESSYFDLSKSDISLSSVTNQGNEFFGQKEYHHPFDGCESGQTVNNNVNNRNECDNNNHIDTSDDGNAGVSNSVKRYSHSDIDLPLNSNTCTPCTETVNSEIAVRTMCTNGDQHQSALYSPDTSLSNEQSTPCNQESVEVNESFPDKKLFTATCSTAPTKCDILPGKPTTDRVDPVLQEHPLVTHKQEQKYEQLNSSLVIQESQPESSSKTMESQPENHLGTHEHQPGNSILAAQKHQLESFFPTQEYPAENSHVEQDQQLECYPLTQKYQRECSLKTLEHQLDDTQDLISKCSLQTQNQMLEFSPETQEQLIHSPVKQTQPSFKSNDRASDSSQTQNDAFSLEGKMDNEISAHKCNCDELERCRTQNDDSEDLSSASIPLSSSNKETGSSLNYQEASNSSSVDEHEQRQEPCDEDAAFDSNYTQNEYNLNKPNVDIVHTEHVLSDSSLDPDHKEVDLCPNQSQPTIIDPVHRQDVHSPSHSKMFREMNGLHSCCLADSHHEIDEHSSGSTADNINDINKQCSSQPETPQEIDRQHHQEMADKQPQQIEDISSNDSSLLEKTSRCRTTNIGPPHTDNATLNNNDLCLQLLPLQAHT